MRDTMSDTPRPVSSSSEPSAPSDGGKSHAFWRVFWLAFLVGSLGYAWYSFYVPSNTIEWADSYSAGQAQASASDKPMILFFTGAWCVPCRIMKRNVWADDEVTTAVNAEFVPVTIDVDDPDSVAALTRYQVGITPTTIVTDAQGNVMQQIPGGLSKADFLDVLDAARD